MTLHLWVLRWTVLIDSSLVWLTVLILIEIIALETILVVVLISRLMKSRWTHLVRNILMVLNEIADCCGLKLLDVIMEYWKIISSSTVILKKLPEKLGDPGKFLISCGFSELKCKALADLGASINLMPLFVWKKLGLPELFSTRMTLELANRAICTPTGISPPHLGNTFLRTARALIDVHEEEMILRDGDKRLTLNMRHDTSSYSSQPKKESINMINIYDGSSEDFLKNLFATNHQSGNLTFSSHLNLTSPKVKDDIFHPEGGNVLTEKLLDLDSTKDLTPPHNVNLLSGSTTSSSPNHLLEEFTDELVLITFPPGNDDLPLDIESDLKEIKYLLNHDPIKDMDSILEDSIDKDNLPDFNDNLVDTKPEIFTNEHAFDYSSPPIYDEYNDDLFED
nr:reverse transcriptase domain-containing protein [Tanacetum cinerariifolium]